jgi:hypothetical protein
MAGDFLCVVEKPHKGPKPTPRRKCGSRPNGTLATQAPKKETKAPRWVAPKSLKQAAKQACQLHGEVESLTESAMNRALRVGKVLKWADEEHKRQKSRGFVKWMEEDAGIPRRTGYNYMDLADEEPSIRSRSEDSKGVLVTAELARIAEEKRKAKPPKPPPKIIWPDSYIPHESCDWFRTSTTVWDLAELKQASQMDWDDIVEEDGVTGVRAQAVGSGTPYSEKFSIFPGVLMEWACLRYLGGPPARIIDPCAGGAVRGAVATIMGYEYHGIDISAEQIAENEERCEDLPHKPLYYVGDGTKLGDYVGGEFDFLFTCPPYYKKELYSGCAGDLSACETYDDFLEKMGEMARAAMPLMKSGAFVCLVLGHVRDQSGKPPSRYLYLPAHIAECFEDAGFQVHQEIIIRGPDGSAAANAGALWTPYKYLVPVHQTMLVFQTP